MVKNSLLSLLCAGAAAGVSAQTDISQLPPNSCQCGNSSLEIPSILDPKSEEGLMLNLSEVKHLKMRFFDRRGREIYQLDLTPNYLQEGQKPQPKQYPTGWKGDHDDDGRSLEGQSCFYIAEIKSNDKKSCNCKGSLMIRK